ncbi:hypothetical protein [Microbacterium sp. IEGM 1404]|uniref:hypothetical protein n=1 Tax=Microbacterium sp. IEGM 1404 TaxID=3047084 RepID=UPI0024B7F5DE|nr:hypothetical protein [Microbacterium sp. IEGM 1404]MDI9890562.1 hypothetical protein [Microbacterium sp. IEGM 1404]
MTHPTPDPRPGRIAAALGTRRVYARGLLALDYETRNALLAEVTRVDSHSVLAWLRTQPTVAAA